MEIPPDPPTPLGEWGTSTTRTAMSTIRNGRTIRTRTREEGSSSFGGLLKGQ